MKSIWYMAWGLLLVSTYSACLITPPPPEPILWMKAVEFETNTPIREMNATPLELRILSDDEFIRLGPESVVVERRVLQVPFEFYGRPVLAESTFARLTRTEAQGGAILELHLTLNPDEVRQIPYETLRRNPDEVLIPVAGSSAQFPLAYNDSGDQMLLPVINFSGNAHTFFLFDIQLDFTKTKFVSVDTPQVIDIPELPASTDRLTNITYEDGFYYAITKDGTFRIDPTDGSYDKIIPTWLYDCFGRNDTLFATGRGLDLHFSTDNGQNWVERDSSTEIRFAEVIGDRVFSQAFTGDLILLSDGELEKARPLKLNDDFPGNPTNAYADLAYFYNGFYLSVQKEIYISCGIQAVEE